MKFRRIGNHRGYCEVVRSDHSAVTARPKPPSKTARAQSYADAIWKRYGGMIGDWAVSGMTQEQIDQFVGGGSRKLEKQARESVADGLADAFHVMRVPLELTDLVKRRLRTVYYVSF